MNSFFAVLLVGISLSMDAFSLALIYGTNGINKNNQLLLSIMVGLFHFFMPLIGFFIGNLIFSFFVLKFNYVISVIFFVIGIEMIMSSYKNKVINILDSIGSYFLFAFSVSIDSFTVGLGLKAINDNYLFIAIVFMFCSFIFTYCGLSFGNKINKAFGNSSTVVGGILLILLSIYYFFNL